MSVSVLSSSNSGLFSRSASAAGSDPRPTRMSGPPNLKRPWEQDHGPPRSFHQHQHLPHQQSQASQPPDPRYFAGPSDHPARGPAPPSHYAPSLSRHSSMGGLSHHEPAHGSVLAHEIQHKRSRIESEPSSAAHSPTQGRSMGRTSPHPGQLPARLPAIGQPAGPGSIPDKLNTSPSAGSPHASFYHSQAQSGSHPSVLPSPGSVTSSVAGSNPAQPPLPSMTSSLLSPVSPSTTHLQNLQHELSTKSLAYSNLAGEHERLLAAYSRLQTRLAALDRKSKTADGELTLLQEERISLQERVESLEKEVDEVRAAKESETEQRNRESEQWRRIIDLSGMVQKRHTEEGEKWKSEKDGLLRRVEGLEMELKKVRLGTGSVGSKQAQGIGGDDAADAGIGSSASALRLSPVDDALADSLRNEVASLKAQGEQTQRQLDEYKKRMGELRDLVTRADVLVNVDREGPKVAK